MIIPEWGAVGEQVQSTVAYGCCSHVDVRSPDRLTACSALTLPECGLVRRLCERLAAVSGAQVVI